MEGHCTQRVADASRLPLRLCSKATKAREGQVASDEIEHRVGVGWAIGLGVLTKHGIRASHLRSCATCKIQIAVLLADDLTQSCRSTGPCNGNGMRKSNAHERIDRNHQMAAMTTLAHLMKCRLLVSPWLRAQRISAPPESSPAAHRAMAHRCAHKKTRLALERWRALVGNICMGRMRLGDWSLRLSAPALPYFPPCRRCLHACHVGNRK